VLNYEGRPEEAIGWLEKAMRLNPRGPETAWYLNELGFAYRLAGRVEEAIASQKQALVHDPNLHFAYTDLYVWHTKMWIWKAAKMAGAACPTLKWQDRKTVGRAVPAIKLARLQHNSRSWCTAHIGAGC
jgi:tetratricopeptide (TPR) repeat protein